MHATIQLVGASLLAAALLVAQPAGARKPEAGPAVGSRIPEFEALDQNGSRQTLESIAGPKGAVLVFYRSADW